mgnify:CR=1 FL=1
MDSGDFKQPIPEELYTSFWNDEHAFPECPALAYRHAGKRRKKLVDLVVRAVEGDNQS